MTAAGRSADALDEAWRGFDLFAPTPDHVLLAETVREFVEREVEEQAGQHDREERFNVRLFRKAGELGRAMLHAPERTVPFSPMPARVANQQRAVEAAHPQMPSPIIPSADS